MKNFKLILICLFCLLSFTACSKTDDTINESTPEVTSSPETTSSPSTSQDSQVYVVYEGIFLDNQEILDLFASIRGETAPFDNVTKEFHVTTEFMPSEAHSKWYGEKLSIHISKYLLADTTMDDGGTTSNEGFKVEVSSDNEEFNEYLKSLNKNFHITGSYKDAAKYTDKLDFSEGEDMNVTVQGTFGGFYSDSSYRFDKE